MSQEDRVLGARFLAVAAEDAAKHVDLVALGVALAGRIPLGLRVLTRLHVDRVGGTDGRAEAAADAALEAVLVAVKLVEAPEARIHLHALLGVAERDRLLEEMRQRDRKTLHQLGDHPSLLSGFASVPDPARVRALK